MAWQTPKTDYTTTQQGVTGSDFNRIEGNLEHLYTYGNSLIKVSANIGRDDFVLSLNDLWVLRKSIITVPAEKKLLLRHYRYYAVQEDSSLNRVALFVRSDNGYNAANPDFETTDTESYGLGSPDFVLFDNTAGSSDVIDTVSVSFKCTLEDAPSTILHMHDGAQVEFVVE